MKSLFNRHEAYNIYGNEVSVEIQNALEPIFEKWAKKGYKTNDIELIAINNASILGAIIRLGISIKKIKQEKNRPVG